MNLNSILAAKHARKVVDTCINVKPDEDVLVVTDTENFDVGEVFMNAVASTGAEPVMCVMKPRDYDYQPPPKAVTEAAKGADALIGAASTFFEAHNVDAVEILKSGDQGLRLWWRNTGLACLTELRSGLRRHSSGSRKDCRLGKSG